MAIPGILVLIIGVYMMESFLNSRKRMASFKEEAKRKVTKKPLKFYDQGSKL